MPSYDLLVSFEAYPKATSVRSGKGFIVVNTSSCDGGRLPGYVSSNVSRYRTRARGLREGSRWSERLADGNISSRSNIWLFSDAIDKARLLDFYSIRREQ